MLAFFFPNNSILLPEHFVIVDITNEQEFHIFVLENDPWKQL